MGRIFSSIDSQLLEHLEGTLDPHQDRSILIAIESDEQLATRVKEYEQLLQLEQIIKEEEHACPSALTDRVMALVEAERELSLLREATGGSGAYARLSALPAVCWLAERLTPTQTIAGVILSLFVMTFSLTFYSHRASLQSEFDLIPVLVPTDDIAEGRRLTAALFRAEVFPRGALPPGAITEISSVEGRYARSLLVGGQPLAPAHVVENKPDGTISAEIKEGYRAVAFPLSIVEAEQVRPGVEVGVIWTTTHRGTEEHVLLVRRAAVISVERGILSRDKTAQQVHYVNLLVSEFDAAKIDLARSTGKLMVYNPGQTKDTQRSPLA